MDPLLQLYNPPTGQQQAPFPAILPSSNDEALAIWLHYQRQYEHATLMQSYYSQAQALGLTTNQILNKNLNMIPNNAYFTTPGEITMSSVLPNAQAAPQMPLFVPGLGNIPFQSQLPKNESPLNNTSFQALPSFNSNVSPALNYIPAEGLRLSQALSPSTSDAGSDTIEVTEPFTHMDDLILAKALHIHIPTSKALASLDGRRRHSTDAWAAYYFANQRRMDKLVHYLYSGDNIGKQRKRRSSMSPAKNGRARDMKCPTPPPPESSGSSSVNYNEDRINDEDEMRVSTKQNPIAYTQRDMRLVVQYLADTPMVGSFCAFWDVFAETHTTHSTRAWGEYYRRNQKEIDKKVKRLLKERKNKRISISHGKKCRGSSPIELQAGGIPGNLSSSTYIANRASSRAAGSRTWS